MHDTSKLARESIAPSPIVAIAVAVPTAILIAVVVVWRLPCLHLRQVLAALHAHSDSGYAARPRMPCSSSRGRRPRCRAPAPAALPLAPAARAVPRCAASSSARAALLKAGGKVAWASGLHGSRCAASHSHLRPARQEGGSQQFRATGKKVLQLDKQINLWHAIQPHRPAAPAARVQLQAGCEACIVWWVEGRQHRPLARRRWHARRPPVRAVGERGGAVACRMEQGKAERQLVGVEGGSMRERTKRDGDVIDACVGMRVCDACGTGTCGGLGSATQARMQHHCAL